MGNFFATNSQHHHVVDWAEKYEIYDLVGRSGQGKLLDLFKKAMKSNDYSKFDEFMRLKAQRYLYRNGEGRTV